MSLSQSGIDALFDETTASETLSSGGRAADGKTTPSSTDQPASGDHSDHPVAEAECILGLSVPVSVVLAQRDMQVGSILKMTPGTIIEFEVPFDSELTLYVANRPIGQGQAVKAGEKFGLHVTRIGTVRQRIDALGGP